MSPTPRPTSAFVVALVSAVLCPILVVIELSALFLAGMVMYEPANSPVVKALSVLVVIIIGLLALALPLLAIFLARKARVAARSAQTGGTGLATAALVIAAIVAVGVVAAQIYYILMAFGSCSLEGC